MSRCLTGTQDGFEHTQDKQARHENVIFLIDGYKP